MYVQLFNSDYDSLEIYLKPPGNTIHGKTTLDIKLLGSWNHM